MDAALLHAYRLVWADGTMLLDTAAIYYSRRPVGGYSLTDFARGLSLLIRHEHDDEDADQLSDREEEEVVDFSEGKEGAELDQEGVVRLRSLCRLVVNVSSLQW
jgi:hypothetical protein